MALRSLPGQASLHRVARAATSSAELYRDTFLPKQYVSAGCQRLQSSPYIIKSIPEKRCLPTLDRQVLLC
jgi:hypothetical protein